MAITINLPNPNVAQVPRALVRSLEERRWQPVVMRSATRTIKGHLADLERTRANKQGWPRSHFFAKCARSTTGSARPGWVTVSIAHVGFRLRLQGGTVLPGRNPSSKTGRPTQWLTIPARAEAALHRAGEFGNLQFVKLSSTSAALVAKGGGVTPGTGRRIGARTAEALAKQNPLGTVFYWLVKRATYKPDPSVLPTEPALAGAIKSDLQGYFDNVIKRAELNGVPK